METMVWQMGKKNRKMESRRSIIWHVHHMEKRGTGNRERRTQPGNGLWAGNYEQRTWKSDWGRKILISVHCPKFVINNECKIYTTTDDKMLGTFNLSSKRLLENWTETQPRPLAKILLHNSETIRTFYVPFCPTLLEFSNELFCYPVLFKSSDVLFQKIALHCSV